MWTPRRIVLLVLGFLGLYAVYVGYGSSAVGRIDGLPPLPDAYLPDTTIDPTAIPPVKHTRIRDKIVMAFGPKCPELTWPIRLEYHKKNMVVSAGQFEVIDDGRVLLKPVSVALFKDHGPGQYPEINTISGELAYLQFDRPIRNLSEISNSKVVKAEVQNRIRIVSNRRRPQRDQDLVINIPCGPLIYDEARHLIQTADAIHLVDHKPGPVPHEVHGHGMDMELLAGEPQPQPGRPARRGKGGESIAGVKRIILYRNVDMTLQIDGKSGFMAGQQQGRGAQSAPPQVAQAPVPGGKAPPPAGKTDQAYLHITTPGRFTYDLFKDHDLATFDVPEQSRPSSPQIVEVVRHHAGGELTDTLQCHHLELRLHRQETADPAAPGGQAPKPGGQARPAGKAGVSENGLEVETAHATSRPGQEVVLTSDGEKLAAHGTDFHYDARKMLTVLKSDSLVKVDKDGSLLEAHEVRIQDVKPVLPPGPAPKTMPKPYQEITALGPGSIYVIDKTTDKRTTQAFWQDVLVSTKDGTNDLLTLTGSARFIDLKEDQSLKGDVIKVWIDPNDRPREAQPAVPGGQPNVRPRHVEATGEHNVIALSRELNVHDTSRLVVWFKDVPAGSLPPASGSPAKPGRPAGGKLPNGPRPAHPPVPLSYNGVGRDAGQPISQVVHYAPMEPEVPAPPAPPGLSPALVPPPCLPPQGPRPSPPP